MEFLSDDATYLAGGLAILAVGFLIALRLTQQGKYLIWAGAALGLALLAVVIEQLWVTESERIERVVYDLRDAVQASDASRVNAHLTPDVEYEQGSLTLIAGDDVRSFVREQLARTHFDFIRITRLTTNAGRQSGRGSAVFRVLTSGSYESGVALNFASQSIDFSLGFRETEPHVWKVERISVTLAPREMPRPGGAPVRPRGRFPSLPRAGSPY